MQPRMVNTCAERAGHTVAHGARKNRLPRGVVDAIRRKRATHTVAQLAHMYGRTERQMRNILAGRAFR